MLLKTKTVNFQRKLTVSLAMLALGFGLSACTSHSPTTNVAKTQSAASETVTPSSVDARSTTSVTQIYTAETGFTPQQISRDVDAAQLTVEQLKAYADRCVPGKTAYRSDIDCSELSLRLKKVFRSDDKVAEALVTLDRLGRSDDKKSVSDELERNYGDLSLSAQAVASGALNTPPPVDLPEDPISDDLEQFLKANGLGINAGIIVNSGG